MMETFSSARKKKENVRCQKVSNALWHSTSMTAFNPSHPSQTALQ